MNRRDILLFRCHMKAAAICVKIALLIPFKAIKWRLMGAYYKHMTKALFCMTRMVVNTLEKDVTVVCE